LSLFLVSSVYAYTSPLPSDLVLCSLFLMMPRRPLRSSLFPYTTLFRSDGVLVGSSTFAPFKLILRFAYVGTDIKDYHLFKTRIRSEEHTSELQSRFDLVCRLLLEKKKEYNPQQNQHHHKFSHTVQLHCV